MFYQVALKERPETSVIFNTEYITRINSTGDAVGISISGSMAEIRVSKDEFNKFKRELKVIDLRSMPKVVRGGAAIMLPVRARDLCVVRVYDDIEQAIRVFKKQVKKARIISELRDRRNNITRAERKILKKQRAVKRMKRSRKRNNT